MDETRLQRLLHQIRELSEELRHFADLVRAETKETHRLAGLTREEIERSRELSQAGQRDLQDVHRSLERGREIAADSGAPDLDRKP